MFLSRNRIVIVDSTIVKRFEFLRWNSIIIVIFTDSFATLEKLYQLEDATGLISSTMKLV